MTRADLLDRWTASIGRPISEIDTPAVLVDLDLLEHNIDDMAARAASVGVDLRPHIKTHKSTPIARRQLGAGASGLTVSKVDEAVAMADTDVGEILLAYPVVTAAKAERAADIVGLDRLLFGLDSLVGAQVLDACAATRGAAAAVVIEIDSGLGRCGVLPDEVEALAEAIRPLRHVQIAGVFTHAGHGYRARDVDELRRIAEAEVDAVLTAARNLQRVGQPVRVISVGSTPTVLAQAPSLALVSEIRPGNYVFRDRTQVSLGVAELEDCAMRVAVTVVSRSRDRAVVDAGSKVFGLDRGAHGTASLRGFGSEVDRGIELAWLSEEHGVITAGADEVRVGDQLSFVPNHACVVADHVDVLLGVREGVVREVLPVATRGGGR